MQLYNGDCLEVMKGIKDKSVDLVLIDPPYLMNYQSGRRKVKYNKIANDKDNFGLITETFEACYRVMKQDTNIYCFAGMHNIDFFKKEFEKKFKLKNILIWEKDNHGMGDLKGSFAPKYEMILLGVKGRRFLNGKRECDILKYSKTGNKIHPTQKPTSLLEKLIEKSTQENNLVLDCFMGSGSTGVACKNTNRNFIGIEMDKQYFEIAKERIEGAK